MSVISARIVRRIAEVSRGPERTSALLRSAGLSMAPAGEKEHEQLVSAEIYYELLERCCADDPTLSLRYGDSVRPEDFGAFGLALKTAHALRDVLDRLSRYILVMSDTLEYTLTDLGPQSAFELRGRPHNGRRGVALANECALAAIVSLLRQVAAVDVTLEGVTFGHPGPADTAGRTRVDQVVERGCQAMAIG